MVIPAALFYQFDKAQNISKEFPDLANGIAIPSPGHPFVGPFVGRN